MIAPYKSMTTDIDWREKLKEGDLIEVFDISNHRTTATVVETRFFIEDELKEIPQVLVGYRTYSDEGKNIDSKGYWYKGLSAAHDEWISAHSPRI